MPDLNPDLDCFRGKRGEDETVCRQSQLFGPLRWRLRRKPRKISCAGSLRLWPTQHRRPSGGSTSFRRLRRAGFFCGAWWASTSSTTATAMILGRAVSISASRFRETTMMPCGLSFQKVVPRRSKSPVGRSAVTVVPHEWQKEGVAAGTSQAPASAAHDDG